MLTGLGAAYMGAVGALASRRILSLKAGILAIDGTKRNVPRGPPAHLESRAVPARARHRRRAQGAPGGPGSFSPEALAS